MEDVGGVLFDTNILIGIANGKESDLLKSIVPGVPCFVSVISIMELFAFAGMSEEEEDGIARILNFTHVIPVSAEIAMLGGRLARTRGKAKFDMLIAATAIYSKVPVITKNTKDFKNIPGLEVRSTL
ncbi:MAG: PIN domain-containing protein [Patescibacteria group bacterium]|jgi:hypothetical protein